MVENLYTIQYHAAKNEIVVLDQRALPNELKYSVLDSLEDVHFAIKELVVRGAPLIGVTAAYGLAMHGRSLHLDDVNVFLEKVDRAKAYLEGARPTAVNLSNALDHTVSSLTHVETVAEGQALLLDHAISLHEEDAWISERIGYFGEQLLPSSARIMTYCNAGSLATSNQYGTALAPVYKAIENGKNVSVVACETRPVLQGARLTSFELTYRGVETTLITDNMMGWYLSDHHIDAIFVGCDRVAVNGDFANKIGTYTLSVVAKELGVPFYVCTPSTTIDFSAKDAADIHIEYRDPEEIRRMWYERPMTTEEVGILNPAFDCTPAENVTGYITEYGILKPPFRKEMFER